MWSGYAAWTLDGSGKGVLMLEESRKTDSAAALDENISSAAKNRRSRHPGFSHFY
jgi:hypothetical protein